MQLANIDFNEWFDEDFPRPWETSVYEEGDDRLVNLPPAKTEALAIAELKKHYPDATIVESKKLYEAVNSAGYFYRDPNIPWRRSHYQCPTCHYELRHVDGEYSGEYGFVRHVKYECPFSDGEWIDQSELTTSGRLHNWMRGKQHEYLVCDPPPDLVIKNPHGFKETLLEARKF